LNEGRKLPPRLILASRLPGGGIGRVGDRKIVCHALRAGRLIGQLDAGGQWWQWMEVFLLSFLLEPKIRNLSA